MISSSFSSPSSSSSTRCTQFLESRSGQVQSKCVVVVCTSACGLDFKSLYSEHRLKRLKRFTIIIVSPIYHAFTHQMFATDDFIAPCIHFNSCLSHIMFESELYLFHVYVYWCVVDYKMCTCIIRSRVSLVWARAGCKKHTCLSITLVNKEFYLISLSPSPPLFSSLYCYIGTSSIRIKRG